jgi:hypothetical protein
MMRILFWTFAVFVVVATVWASFASNRLTSDQNRFVWAIVLCIVFVSMACGIAYLLFYCWKKRIAMIAGRYGGGGQYSRDTQPIRYWGIMILYVLCFLVFAEGIHFCVSIMLTVAKHFSE